MTKKILTAAVYLACACVVVYTGLWALFNVLSWPPKPIMPTPEPITTTPEPIAVEQVITVDGGWEWILEDVAIFEEPGGCVCGEPRDDGRMCDVYVEIITDTMMKVWTDVSPEQLGDVAGVEWAEGRAVGRDPRYSWQSIVDGICALR